MDKYGLEFHHLGLAVTHPEKAVIFLKGLGYIIGESLYDAQQKVNLIYCKHENMPEIELISRADSPGPLDAVLRDFTEVIYHICYSCTDVDSVLDTIKKENRVITISAPKPAILFNKRRVSFYKIAGFGLIEILENI